MHTNNLEASIKASQNDSKSWLLNLDSIENMSIEIFEHFEGNNLDTDILLKDNMSFGSGDTGPLKDRDNENYKRRQCMN